MITTYLDKGCRALKDIQELELDESYSALWFGGEKSDDIQGLLSFLSSVFNSFIGLFWLASSGGYGSSKILDIKRAFGSWQVSKWDVHVKNELYEEDGGKLYSDVAKINKDTIELLAGVCNRQLFGTDSNIFFLPMDTELALLKVHDSTLGELLIKRNAALQIDKTLQDYKFIEKYVDGIVVLGGVATIVMRDANMCMSIVAVGDQLVISRLSQGLNMNCSSGIPHKSISDADFQEQLRVGIRVSSLS